MTKGDNRTKIIKIGTGNIGGKARGLSFFNNYFPFEEINQKIAPHKILVPPTTVIATDEFDNFIEKNKLFECIDYEDDTKIKKRFLKAELRDWLKNELRKFLEHNVGPIAVRSSSLNEDAYNHPFAGLYLTLILPNIHPQIEVRQAQLERAIKLVYASTFFQNPKRYMRNYRLSIESEKMGIILQKLVGKERDGYFYPMVAGVTQSLNFFPISYLKTEDGISLIVLGLGKKAVEGGNAIRFSPKYPLVRPQFQTPKDILRSSQRDFIALDLNTKAKLNIMEDKDTLVNLGIEVAEKHGVLQFLASTWDPKDQVLYEGIFRNGYRILTFNKLLTEEIFPLPTVLRELLKFNEEGFSAPVDMEWALELEREDRYYKGYLYFLQVRPLPTRESKEEITIEDIPKNRILIDSYSVLGHGILKGIKNIVYVKIETFKPGKTHEIAKEVAILNDRIFSKGEDYILIGPGRWGSTNPMLGIPVTYAQICNARVICELGIEDFKVEPSQGTHFFHNITSGRISYFAVNYTSKDYVNYDWFKNQKDHGGLELVKHIIFEPGITVKVDGVQKRGVIYIEDSNIS